MELVRTGDRGVQEVGSSWVGKGPLPRKMALEAMLGSTCREQCECCHPSCDPLALSPLPKPFVFQPGIPSPSLLFVEPFCPSSHQSSFLLTNCYGLLHRLGANILERK